MASGLLKVGGHTGWVHGVSYIAVKYYLVCCKYFQCTVNLCNCTLMKYSVCAEQLRNPRLHLLPLQTLRVEVTIGMAR